MYSWLKMCRYRTNNISLFYRWMSDDDMVLVCSNFQANRKNKRFFTLLFTNSLLIGFFQLARLSKSRPWNTQNKMYNDAWENMTSYLKNGLIIWWWRPWKVDGKLTNIYFEYITKWYKNFCRNLYQIYIELINKIWGD